MLSRQTFTHFLTVVSKNPQHDCVKPRGGGSRAVYTMCKKTSDLVEDGFPYLMLIMRIRWQLMMLIMRIKPASSQVEDFIRLRALLALEGAYPKDGSFTKVLWWKHVTFC